MLYMFQAVPLPIITSSKTLHVSGSSSAHHQELKNSTCFRRFLCPSSGAQKLYMFQAVPLPIIRSSKTVHTASGFC
jgi:hypothetical protein